MPKPTSSKPLPLAATDPAADPATLLELVASMTAHDLAVLKARAVAGARPFRGSDIVAEARKRLPPQAPPAAPPGEAARDAADRIVRAHFGRSIRVTDVAWSSYYTDHPTQTVDERIAALGCTASDLAEAQWRLSVVLEPHFD